MDKKIKFIGLLLILPSLLVLTNSNYVYEAEALGDPYIEMYSISALENDMYKVIFTVHNPTSKNIHQWLLVHVSSDTSSKDVRSSWISANSYTYVPVLIQADDPSTITAELDHSMT